jgi:hypothetical protein
MVVVPALIPRIKPLDGLRKFATAVLVLLQVPPGVPVVNRKVAAPAHIVEDPMMVPAVGEALTVILYWATSNPQPFSM